VIEILSNGAPNLIQDLGRRDIWGSALRYAAKSVALALLASAVLPLSARSVAVLRHLPALQKVLPPARRRVSVGRSVDVAPAKLRGLYSHNGECDELHCAHFTSHPVNNRHSPTRTLTNFRCRPSPAARANRKRSSCQNTGWIHNQDQVRIPSNQGNLTLVEWRGIPPCSHEAIV